jgi:drug/metabolite transporter (DMT)-like permease
MSAPSSRLVGLLLALAAPLSWSIGGLIIRSVETEPWDIVFWRAFGHVLCFPLALWWLWGRSVLVDLRAVGRPALAVAFFMACTLIFHVLAMTRTTVANVLILQSMSPLLVAVLAWIFLDERLRASGWVILAVAFAGLALVIGGSLGAGDMSGDLFALVVAVCSAAHVTLIRRHRTRNLAAVTLPAAVLAIGVSLLFARPLSVRLPDIGLLILLGGVQMSFGLTCFILALRYLPAAEVTLIALLEPILGPIWVWLLIGEQPAASTIIGGTIVLGALVAHVTLAARRARQVPTP